MNQSLTQRANQFGLILDDISITHLTFGREFTQAVELKQVAQQEAEKARFLVEKAEQIKQANIINAEGDTQAAELLATAIGKILKVNCLTFLPDLIPGNCVGSPPSKRRP